MRNVFVFALLIVLLILVQVSVGQTKQKKSSLQKDETDNQPLEPGKNEDNKAVKEKKGRKDKLKKKNKDITADGENVDGSENKMKDNRPKDGLDENEGRAGRKKSKGKNKESYGNKGRKGSKDKKKKKDRGESFGEGVKKEHKKKKFPLKPQPDEPVEDQIEIKPNDMESESLKKKV